MTSPTQWTWVWVNSRSWWWTGRPGVLQSTGLQRVGHDWATELKARRSGASLGFRSLKIMFFSTSTYLWAFTFLFALPGITFVQDSLLHILKVFPLNEFIPSYPAPNQHIQTSKSNPSKYLTPLPGDFFILNIYHWLMYKSIYLSYLFSASSSTVSKIGWPIFGV